MNASIIERGRAVTLVECRTCILCGTRSVIGLPTAGVWAWEHGALVQEAFPTLEPATREMLITGTHPECWTALMTEDLTDENGDES